MWRRAIACAALLALVPWAGSASGGAASDEALRNLAYQGVQEQPVELRDGRWEGPPYVPVPGSARMLDYDRDGRADLLLTDMRAERELFQIRLANELAHYTDGAIRFSLPGSRPAENAQLTSELARAMDHEKLANELDYWAGYCAERPLSKREIGAPLEIELPARHWWAAGRAERAAVKLARSLRRWYRRDRASR